uniref:Uncharacterized protein n=1 Tax=Megaselia scalaris TaxID=36166 RepID=T1GG30_MEGSC
MAKLKKRRFEKQQFEEHEFMRDRHQAMKFYEHVNKQWKKITPQQFPPLSERLEPHVIRIFGPYQ